MRFTRAQRLTTDAQLQRVFEEGKLARTKYLSVRSCASPQPYPRIGLVVPRHGMTAVRRNRLKRRLREIARRDLLPHLPPLDVVIRATPAAYGLGFPELRDEVLKTVRRLLEARSPAAG